MKQRLVVEGREFLPRCCNVENARMRQIMQKNVEEFHCNDKKLTNWRIKWRAQLADNVLIDCQAIIIIL